MRTDTGLCVSEIGKPRANRHRMSKASYFRPILRTLPAHLVRVSGFTFKLLEHFDTAETQSLSEKKQKRRRNFQTMLRLCRLPCGKPLAFRGV
jgi:hypothetical protein